MAPVPMALGEITDLGTQVAMHGAVRAGEIQADEIFEMIVGVVALIVEIAP